MANYYERGDYPPCREGEHKRQMNGSCHPCGLRVTYDGFTEEYAERLALREENQHLRAALAKAQSDSDAR